MDDRTARALLPSSLRLEGPPALRALWASGAAGCFVDGRSELLIGRDPACDLVIDDRSVSRRHARVYVDDPAIEDLGSTAGTFVAGRRIPPHDPVSLVPGAVVEVGVVVVVVPQAAEAVSVPAPTEEVLARLAASPVGVLVVGEPGSGQDGVARALHARSGRSGPFVAVTCADLGAGGVRTLFGSTGAEGAVQRSAGGVLFLDDVGDLPPDAQAALLQVLDRPEAPSYDLRIVSSTSRDLRPACVDGSFREALYWHLAGVTLRVPALRERRDDLPRVAGALLRDIAGPDAPAFSPAALAHLAAQDWPGNLPALRDALERAVLFADDLIEVRHLALGAGPA